VSSENLSAFAATLSVVSVLISAVLSYHLAQRSRLDRAEDLATRFREPLLQAAYNLQSRIYNIVKQDFLGRFYSAPEASEQERTYAVNNTCFLFGQYLCWVEIIRRESQYVDPRSRETNRAIVEKLEHVRDCMAESVQHTDRALRLFRGEQRAVGELMVVPVPMPTGDVPRWECMGYAAFSAAMRDPDFHAWFAPVADGVKDLAAVEDGDFPQRLTELQHALIDLMDVLDRDRERVPARFRGRI
jgi:hypothetical protein